MTEVYNEIQIKISKLTNIVLESSDVVDTVKGIIGILHLIFSKIESNTSFEPEVLIHTFNTLEEAALTTNLNFMYECIYPTKYDTIFILHDLLIKHLEIGKAENVYYLKYRKALSGDASMLPISEGKLKRINQLLKDIIDDDIPF